MEKQNRNDTPTNLRNETIIEKKNINTIWGKQTTLKEEVKERPKFSFKNIEITQNKITNDKILNKFDSNPFAKKK